MRTFYISFGQGHAHRMNNQTIDKDCVVRLEAPNEHSAHAKADELFGQRWSMLYKEIPNMEYFPRGFVDL